MSGLILVGTLHLDVGVALTSLFAFSGVGTIVLSLASQNIATGLMNGFETSVSQNFVVGDEIRMRAVPVLGETIRDNSTG